MTERLPFHFSLSCIGEGNGNPFQYSCLENPRDGGIWWASVYGVTQSLTWLKWLSNTLLINVKLLKKSIIYHFFYRSHVVEKLCESKEGSQHRETFSQILNLNTHQKTPSGVKPCECHVCEKVFMHHSFLNRHVWSHTVHKPYEYHEYKEKPYKRKECGKTFSYHKSVHRHERSHTGEKLYECKECRKAFTWLTTFWRHMVTHWWFTFPMSEMWETIHFSLWSSKAWMESQCRETISM